MPKINVERSKVLHAPKEEVIKIITDMERFKEYDAWGIAEPSAKSAVSSPSSGVGAWHAWDGSLIGSGKMTVKAIADDSSKVDLHLQFFKPRKDKSDAYWRLEDVSENGKTYCKATWGIAVKLAWFMAPFAKSFANMFERMIGEAYELALIKLAHIIDSSEPSLEIILCENIKLESLQYVGIPFIKKTIDQLIPLYEMYYPKITAVCKENSLSATGPAFTLYTAYNRKTGEVSGVIAETVDKKVSLSSEFVYGTLPSRYYSKLVHKGSYDTLKYAWGIAGFTASRQQDKKSRGLPSLECYTHMAEHENDVNITDILIPVKK